MKLIKCCLVIFVLFYISNDTAWAQQCISKETQVAFANGVYANDIKIYESLDKVTSLIESKLENNGVELDVSDINQANPDANCKGISFGFQYNPSAGVILDLFESLEQDFITDISRFWLILSGLDIMPDFFRDALADKAAKVDGEALTIPTTQDYVDIYNQLLGTGAEIKLISVSHSQGNLFSNTIYANLNGAAQNNYKIVSVANPDSFVADDGPYTTLTADFVIFVIRAFKLLRPGVSLPLPANTTNATVGEFSGHDFLKSYLQSGSNSQTQIIDDIFGLIDLKDIAPVDCLPPGISVGGDCVVI